METERKKSANDLIQQALQVLEEDASTIGVSKKRRTLRVRRAAFAICLILTCVSVYGFPTAAAFVRNERRMAKGNIRLYWESECVNEVSSIAWGTVRPGESYTVTIYVRNVGTEALTLELGEKRWKPRIAATYMLLRWDYTDETIEPGTTRPVTLNLTVSEYAEGIDTFSFDILVTGTYGIRNEGTGKGKSK